MSQFQYEPFSSRPYLSTISELLQEPGRAQARAAEIGGQAKAQALMQTGQGISGAVQQYFDPAMQDRRALDQAYSGGLDRQSILDKLPGHLKPIVQRQFAEADEAALKVQKLRDETAVAERDYFGSLAAGVKAHNYDPSAAMIALQHAKQLGYGAQADQIWAQMQRDPSHIQSIVDTLIAQSPKQAELMTAAKTAEARTTAANTGAKRLELETPKITAETQKLVGEVEGTLPMTPAQKAAHDVALANLGVSRGRLKLEQEKFAQQQNDQTNLTPEGLDAAALNYAKTGQLPPLGMGDKQTRKQIINRAAEMMPGLDIASAKADFEANKASLTKLQTQRDAISAFEKTAKKNIAIFLEQAGKVVDTGSPMANAIARQVTGKMLGSSNQAAYDAARQVAINEIAKITSNPNLSGTLSDSARQEVEAFNPKSATLKQTVAVMRLLTRDMENRAGSMDEQIAGIKTRIGKAQGSSSEPPKEPAGNRVYYDANGNPIKKP